MADTSLGFNLIGRDVSATKALQGVAKEAANTGGSFKKIGEIAAGVFGGNLMANAASSVMNFGKESLNAFQDVGKEVIKLQRYTGGTAEEMSKLRFAAEETGVSTDTLALGLGKMEKSAAGSSKAFDALGISTKESNGHLKNATDLFMETSQKISELGNGTEKTAAVMGIFGRNGMALLPMLNKGKEGISEFAAEAQKMGLVLTNDNLVAVKANIQAHREFDASVKGMQVQLGQYLYPALTAITAGFAQIVPVIADHLKPAFAAVGQVMSVVVDIITNYAMPALSWLADIISQTPTPILAMAAAFAVMSSSIGQSFSAAILGAVASLRGMLTQIKFNVQFTKLLAVEQAAAGASTGIFSTGMAMAGIAAQGLAAAVKGVFVSLGPIGLAIGLAAGAMALFTNKSQAGNAATEAWTQSLYDQNGALVANAKALAAAGLAKDETLAKSAQFGISTADITKALLGDNKQLEAIKSKLRGVVGQETQYTGDRLSPGYVQSDAVANAETAKAILSALDGSKSGLDSAAATAKRTREALQALGQTVTTVPTGLKATGGAAKATAAEFVILDTAMLGTLDSVDLGIGSLSKLGRSLGGVLIANFTAGIRAAGKVTKDTASAFTDLANEIKSNFTKALADANKQLDDAVAAFNNYRDQISGSISSGNELADAASAQSAAIQAVADATKAQADAQLALNEAKKGEDTTTIATAQKTYDEASATLADATKKQGSFIDFLQIGADTATEFSKQIDQLRIQGATLALTQQVAALGAKTGGRIVAELIAGTQGGIQKANELIQTVVDVSQAAGVAAATQFFQGGINAAQALVEGLKSQLPAIQSMLQSIADMINAAMHTDLKVDLGADTTMNVSPQVAALIDQIGAPSQYQSYTGGATDYLRGLIPGYATGGVFSPVSGGHVIRVAEGGEAEAVVPLSKMGTGGINVTVNVGGSVVQEQDLAISVRDQIAQLIRRRGGNPAILGV